MIIRAKYKIARRLNAPVFEKTQSQKYALREGRKEKRNFSRSNFSLQLLEKQKARYTYGLSAKQFANYVKSVLSKRGVNQQEMLLGLLEGRLDNAVYRTGFAPTRQAARQMVSHGHILVNGHRVTIPSYGLSKGDKLAIREGSKSSGLFKNIDETLKKQKVPAWLSLDVEKRTVSVEGQPVVAKTDLLFEVAPVLEFYSR